MKKYSTRLQKQAAEEIVFLARRHRVTVRFFHDPSKFGGISAGWEVGTRNIYIYAKQSKWDLLSQFVHELNHVRCFDEMRYWSYHRPDWSSSRERFNAAKRCAYRAECYVDRMAEEMFNLQYPGVRYRGGWYAKYPERGRALIAALFGDYEDWEEE